MMVATNSAGVQNCISHGLKVSDFQKGRGALLRMRGLWGEGGGGEEEDACGSEVADTGASLFWRPLELTTEQVRRNPCSGKKEHSSKGGEQ